VKHEYIIYILYSIEIDIDIDIDSNLFLLLK
jgi:hypothetical protein